MPPVDSLRLTDVALRSRAVAGAVGKGVDARTKASREPMARPTDRWISLVSFMGSRYDSNVNRDLVPTRSVGMVSGLGLRLQAGADRAQAVKRSEIVWHIWRQHDSSLSLLILRIYAPAKRRMSSWRIAAASDVISNPSINRAIGYSIRANVSPTCSETGPPNR